MLIDNLGSDNNQDFSNKSNISQYLRKYLYHWPVFLLGVFFCFSVAYLYLRYKQPVYSVNSTLLIKDDKKGNLPTGGDLLNELDLFGSSKVVENEIEILKSKTLMRKVVDRLNLAVTYVIEGTIKETNLYAKKPAKVRFLHINDKWIGKELVLSFPDSASYQFVDVKSGLVFKGSVQKLQRDGLGVYEVSKINTLNKGERIHVKINDPKVVVDYCLRQLSISIASKQSSVLKLSFQSAIPEMGEDILNTLTSVYNEAALEDKNQITQSTIRFIEERLKLITGELTAVEKDVEGFKSSQGITDITSDANLFLDQVKANDVKLSEVNLQISVMNDILRYLNSDSEGEKLPSTFGINDAVLLAQIGHLEELQLERDRILATTTPNNPLMQPVTRQIETTRAGVRTSISNILKSLQVSRRDLQQNSGQFQSSIKKLPKQERQLISIKRQQAIKESLYLYLLQKKEEAALSYASSVADSRIVDSAFYSKNPIEPRRQVVYFTALLLGLLLPIGYIQAKEILNNKVESVSDISSYTQAPILGQISFNDGEEQIVMEAESRKAIAEQFRALRTNMQFVHNGTAESGRVTLFTSSMSGEGKTFVATNLAAALALAGKKTIVLELDLRKPKVSLNLGLENRIGLSNYLIGASTVSEVIVSSGISKNFFVIGSGPIPPNPSELLIKKNLEDLIDYLRAHFDEIIIDSPPIGLVTDAQILSRVADVTIYMVREGITMKEQLLEVDKLYRSKRFPAFNIVLNGIKLGGTYGYGYGYGYYSDDIKADHSLLNRIKDLLKRF
jgi:capsular exopolysaccharide synthesis family protein